LPEQPIFRDLRMKKVVILSTLALSFTLFCSPVHAERILISVNGMVCSFCAQGIKKTFGRKDAVEDVAVDLDKKVVTIATKDSASLTDAEIKESIVDAGYEVLTIERTSND
jgi:copper chaperone CopZ